ncbi:uncharacterized protein LOC100246776 [Vitis vinifera]|eukprot:XP_019077329.1 PREDICTED: uncharacterized protein LOC100246776 [Vitis vinifera]
MNNFAMNPTAGTQLILLLLIAHFTISPGRCHALEMRPVESTQYQVVEAALVGSHTSHLDGRRKLAPFQLCLVCKCCAAGGADPTTGTCATMPCCFGIDCQLPNKPFGVCAFVPKTCNCTSCAV